MKNATIKQGLQFYEVSSPPPKGGEWVEVADFEETRQIIGKSFAGTSNASGEPIFDWAINHIPEWYTPEDHKSVATLCIGFPLYAAMKKNALVVSKRLEGEVVSAAVVLEYKRRKTGGIGCNGVVEAWHFFKAFCKLMQRDRLPTLFADKDHKKESSHFQKKMKAMGTSLTTWHEEGPEEVHWYVQLVGVAPEHNGTGLGRELMEKVNDLADQVGVSCYLECGASKKGFYEKMGYRVLSRRLVDDPVNCKREPLEVYIMLRKPLPSTL
jgi:GNAT superfamily N-acetyltransferase